MSELLKVHCNACGGIIEYASEKEGTTTECPACGNQVWYSQLAEVHTHPKSHRSSHGLPSDSKGRTESHPWTLGMLAVLLLMNMYLGYMVIGLKEQMIELKRQPTDTKEIILKSTNMVVSSAARRALSRANTNQELVESLIEAVEIMDNELQLQLSAMQNTADLHNTQINDLMETTSQLSASIVTIYDDITNIGTSLEQISQTLSEVQDNQTILQNTLMQNR